MKLYVEGMMCAHCKARVEQALRSVDGVADATADPASGTAEVTFWDKAVPEDALKAAVTNAGYEYRGIAK